MNSIRFSCRLYRIVRRRILVNSRPRMYRRCCHFLQMHQQEQQLNFYTPQETIMNYLNPLLEEALSLHFSSYWDKSTFWPFLLEDVQQELQKLAMSADVCDDSSRLVTGPGSWRHAIDVLVVKDNPSFLFVPPLSTWSDGVCVSGGRSCKRGFCRKDDACTARF